MAFLLLFIYLFFILFFCFFLGGGWGVSSTIINHSGVASLLFLCNWHFFSVYYTKSSLLCLIYIHIQDLGGLAVRMGIQRVENFVKNYLFVCVFCRV